MQGDEDKSVELYELTVSGGKLGQKREFFLPLLSEKLEKGVSAAIFFSSAADQNGDAVNNSSMIEECVSWLLEVTMHSATPPSCGCYCILLSMTEN